MKSLYLNTRFYLALLLLMVSFVIGFFIPIFYVISLLIFVVILVILAVEIFLLYQQKTGIHAERKVPERLSNGDENEVVLQLENSYPFQIQLKIIDELPFQFQKRDFEISTKLLNKEKKNLRYYLRPNSRGIYEFGALNLFVTTKIGFISKRIKKEANQTVAVYPSFLNLRTYELIASKTALLLHGTKRTRKIGQSSEFEQIKEYVLGDDLRHVNWKATAKRQHLMVNHYQEERAQNIYLLIDKGRAMKMPFDGMSLLDYAINSALMLANIALKKQDKAGLLTFEKKTDTFIKSDNKPLQLRRIMETLYQLETSFKESDYQYLLTDSLMKIQKRSLLVLFTNFETLDALKRQLPYLRVLSKKHVLLVIIFENTLLKEVYHRKTKTTKALYTKTIANKFLHEKQLIVQELQMHGIKTVYTQPANLSVNLLNKYLEIKHLEII